MVARGSFASNSITSLGQSIDKQQTSSASGASTAAGTGATNKGNNPNADTMSVNSGGSGGTESTGTAEDTMNNLKKTFASIFGDKCE